MDAGEGKSEHDVAALRAEIEQLKSDLSSVTGTLKNMAAEAGAHTYDRFKESAEKARQRGQRTGEAISSQIEERPVISVISAFVVGLLLGALFSRRK